MHGVCVNQKPKALVEGGSDSSPCWHRSAAPAVARVIAMVGTPPPVLPFVHASVQDDTGVLDGADAFSDRG